jgi:hypothetical protein
VKNVLCGGCGKYHELTPGKLSSEDLKTIDKIRKLAREYDTVYDIIEGTATKDAEQYIKNDADYHTGWQ